MIPRPPRSTRTDTLFPYTTLFRSLCWAGGLSITRQMRGSEGALTILIWSTIAGLVAIAPLGIADWRDPTLGEWAFLAAIAVCHVAGQYLTIRAFMLASASLLAPFSYSTLLRSEDRRGGKECVSKGSYRWSP